MAVIELEESLLRTEVSRNDEGEYIIKVIVDGGTINEWTLGHDETIAKGKVSTILSTYTKGLEFVQEQVRQVFAEEEEATK